MLDKFKFFKDKDKSKAGAKPASSAKGANAKGKDKRLSDEAGAGPSGAAVPPEGKVPNGNVSQIAAPDTGAAGGRESPKPGKDCKEKKSSKLLGGKSKKQEAVNGATPTPSQAESQLQKRSGAIPTSKSVSGSLLKKANGSSGAKLQPSSSVQAKLDKNAAAVATAQRDGSPSQTRKQVTKIAGINKANLSGKTKSSAGSSAGSTLSLGGASSASSGIPAPGLTSIPKPGSKAAKAAAKEDGKVRSLSKEKSRDQLAKRESGEVTAQNRPTSPTARNVSQSRQQQQQQLQQQQQRLQMHQQQQQALQQQKAMQQQQQQQQYQEQQRRSHEGRTGHYGIPGDSTQVHADAVAQHHAAQQQQARQQQQAHQLQQQMHLQQQQRLSHGSMIAMGKHAKTPHPSKISQGLSPHPQSPGGHPQQQSQMPVAAAQQQQGNVSSQSRVVKTGAKPTKVDSDTQTNVSAINRVITPSKDALTRGINAQGTPPKGPNKEQSSHSLTSNDSATVSSGGESGGNSHSTSNSHSSNDSVIFKPSSVDEGESGLESDSNKSGDKQRFLKQQQPGAARPAVQDHISSLRKNSAHAQVRNGGHPMSPHGSKMETTFGAGHVRTETKNKPKSPSTKSPKETTFAEKDESDDVLIQNIKPMQPILRASPYAYLNIGKSNALPRPSFHISTTLSSQVSSLAHSQSASSRLGVNRPLIDPSKYSLTQLNLKHSTAALSGSGARSVQDDDCASDADSADLAAGYMSDGDILRSNHLDDINRYP